MSHLYEFGPYTLDPQKRSLMRGTESVSLAPKTFDLMLALVQSEGRALTKRELMTALWPDTFVEEANLTFQISTLRKALGDEGGWIETVPRHGYRFAAPVRVGGTQPESTTVPVTSQVPAAPAAPSVQRRVNPYVVLVALGVLAAAGLGWWYRSGRTTSVESPELVRLTSDAGLNTHPSLSADGQLLAYASDRSGAGDLDIWVRQIKGGSPIRVTNHPADDHEPVFSPDGSQIVFRSERDGGGVYVVSSFGGDARLLAAGGRRPRISPDGKQVAYWTGSISDIHLMGSGTAKVFVAPLAGGPSRDFQPGFAAARYPVWSADGKWILFAGARSPEVRLDESQYRAPEWYVSPVEGGQAKETGARDLLAAKGLTAPPQAVEIAPADWKNDRVLLAASSDDTANLWIMDLPLRSRGRSSCSA